MEHSHDFVEEESEGCEYGFVETGVEDVRAVTVLSTMSMENPKSLNKALMVTSMLAEEETKVLPDSTMA